MTGLDMQRKDCEVMGTHGNYCNAQVSILKKRMNVINYLEF